VIDETPWATLVVVRHGQSVWNQENIFTGWVDVDLSDQGVEEARQAGECLREMRFVPGIAYTSVLRRAIRTLWLMLDVSDLMWVPVEKSWRLNERHYGGLQGKNKAETAESFGADQVHVWRRSFGVRPPLLDADSEMNPSRDRRYQHIDCRPDELPLGESLEDTTGRVLPYWEATIAPRLREGVNVLIVAHGNSLRALVKHLERVSDNDIADVNIPTGRPKVYELNASLNVMRCHYYGDPR
jgi:2,3-bisphosphoglycerate-dependent phosphoglycerate mutase